MEPFYEYTLGLTIFAKKVLHICSTGLYIGLRKYRNFQREAKLEQIIAIVTTHSVFLFHLYHQAWRHPLSTYAKFYEKLTFLTP